MRIPHLLYAFSLAMALLLAPLPALATEGDSVDETMLMFVGEAEPVATVASRQPESPALAPALVNVVGREEIERMGYATLAELLADQPGFFFVPSGRGSAPYLRGLRDSVLFLYDGVPLTTDVTRNLAPLDQELSLAGVERVELVRGPGSVLWGPDAFAGVVNIVPSRGRQRPGPELALSAGSQPGQGASLNWGWVGGRSEAFALATGLRQRFSEPDYQAFAADGSAGTQTVQPSEFGELAGSFQHGDWLSLTGRWSDFRRRYTMRDAGGLSWAGEKEAPVNLLKATASRVVGPSHYALSGFVQQTDYRLQDGDVERSQTSRASELSLLWDRRLLSRGLVTAGASWRQSSVEDAVVQDGFLPDFLAPAGSFFVPVVQQEDFSNDLASLFAQFRHQWGGTEWWLGGRLDDHSQYSSTLSYSLGLNRPLAETLRLKASFGNAFRSPYSSQLFGTTPFEPESIETASVQLAWNPSPGRLLELTLFASRVEEHRAEDPYGGLSLPASRELRGLELAVSLPLAASLRASGSLALSEGGGDERFRALRYTIIRPDGSREELYEQWNEPLDQGPGWLVNLGLGWRLGPGRDLSLSARTWGEVEYSYASGSRSGSYSAPLLLDLSYRRPGFLAGRDSFVARLENLLDQEYRLPDLYGPAAGPPLTASLLWKVRF